MYNLGSYKTIIFTDPNVPGFMKISEGGDIDDLFMIIHAILNCPYTLFVLGGAGDTHINRCCDFTSNLPNLVKKASEKNSHFISKNDFLDLSKKQESGLVENCYIFCPIDKGIYDYCKRKLHDGKRVFIQGTSSFDFNIKESELEIQILLIQDINNRKIKGITSIESGIQIPMDIDHPYILAAQNTALAKTLGINELMKNLANFYICRENLTSDGKVVDVVNGKVVDVVNGKVDASKKLMTKVHKDNGCKSGIDLQFNLIGNVNDIGGKGNNSIPILSTIANDTEYVKYIFDFIPKILPNTDANNATSVVNNFSLGGSNSDNKSDILLGKLFDKEPLKTNITKMLNSVDERVKIILLFIFGYAYKLCGADLINIFDGDGTIKKFSQINVNELTRNMSDENKKN